ncbi:MAG: thiamine phosphate synthase, partial [Bacteroidota bacterium]
MIENIQYISQDNNGLSHLENIEAACLAGVKWVQLRVKKQDSSEWLRIAFEARDICDRYNVTLIINDNADIALNVAADGVHLGLEDMPVKKARQILGSGKIIGATANTMEHIRAHAADGADYIGLGPFRFTETKEKLRPILGIEG